MKIVPAFLLHPSQYCFFKLRNIIMKKKRETKHRYKKNARKIHLYLGLSTGLVVFILAITGCLWVFQEEIRGLYKTTKVIEQDAPFLTATQAKAKAQKVFPDKDIHGVSFGQPDEALEVIFYEAKPKFYQKVYLNPYTGEVVYVEDYLSGFFPFILRGHQYLWLPESIGSKVTAYSTLLFFVMIVTGLILWWPKNKKGRKQRFGFVWKASTNWKRKNFDLHTVVGFYISVFALVFAFTGSVMAFNWFYFIAFKATGGTKAPQFIIPNTTSGIEDKKTAQPIDELIPLLRKTYPKANNFELHYPASDTASIYVEIFQNSGVYYNVDYRFYDQNTLKELSTPSIYGAYKDASFADMVIRTNYDIHVGSIGGIVGKIIAFLASIITASLPVTGFLIWWGKRKKQKIIRQEHKNTAEMAV